MSNAMHHAHSFNGAFGCRPRWLLSRNNGRLQPLGRGTFARTVPRPSAFEVSADDSKRTVVRAFFRIGVTRFPSS